MRTTMRKTRRSVVRLRSGAIAISSFVAASVGLWVGFAGTAHADNILNTVTDPTYTGVNGIPNTSLVAGDVGSTVTVGFRVESAFSDLDDFCNIDSFFDPVTSSFVSESLVVSINTPSGVNAAPSSLTFTGCFSAFQNVVFTAGALGVSGDVTLSITSNDTGDGIYNLTSFPITVTQPADTTDPSISITTPTASASFELNAVVSADYSCSDANSGVATCVGNVADGATIDTSMLGGHTFTVTASDVAGNTDQLVHNYTVVDTTDPQISITTPTDGAVIQMNSAVAADFACSDSGGSGIASCIGTVTDGAAINTSTLGGHLMTVVGTDNEGNSVVVVHDYTVVDTIDPQISISSPASGEIFELHAVVVADFSCSDAGSGVSTCVGTVADGAAINTSTLGAHSFSVNASDLAGSTDSLVHNYTVADSIDPQITISSPLDNAVFSLNAVIAADFSCSDTGGSGVASCAGNVADGAAINTSSLGAHTFTVNVSDVAGNTKTLHHDYTIVAVPIPTPPTTPPNGTTQTTTPPTVPTSAVPGTGPSTTTTPPSTVPTGVVPGTGPSTTTTTLTPAETTTTSPIEVAGTQITVPPDSGIANSSSTWNWWLWLLTSPLLVALGIRWEKIMGGRRRRAAANAC